MKNKLLVVTTRYPKTNISYGGIFYHTRNLRYIEHNIEVVVISFESTQDYEIDGIKVIGYKNFMHKEFSMDEYTLICHAPDHNTYLFLCKYEKYFKNIIFFFHGNEILKLTKYYQIEFTYSKRYQNIVIQNIRDCIKIFMWKNKFKKISKKSKYIFVSQWMYKESKECLGKNAEILKNNFYIIYNCIGRTFQNQKYLFEKEKQFDFITIRGNFDSAKYGIDIVNKLALNNPQFKFCVVGKGDYFNYYKKANNLITISKVLEHQEIIELCNNSKFALMPTRHDAQGVMACELASFGIPLITSDIEVCKEVFKNFHNVFYINNEMVTSIKLENYIQTYNNLKLDIVKDYFTENTCDKEIELIKGCL